MPSGKVSTVGSTDGVQIGYRTLGEGPDLVVVHGSIATGEQWAAVAAILAPQFTVHLMDRRGRGLSGDATEYSLAQEADDVRAVLSAVAPGASLLAHSYGAICALEALVKGAEAAGVVLYEPPLPVNGPVAGAALAPMVAAVDAGELDDALALALTDIVHVPAEAVAGCARLRCGRAWPR